MFESLFLIFVFFLCLIALAQEFTKEVIKNERQEKERAGRREATQPNASGRRHPRFAL